MNRLNTKYTFFRSGLIDIGINNLRRAGLGGYAWSLRANSGMDFAHNLDFNASSVGPSYSDGRWLGFPLRCLARQYIINYLGAEPSVPNSVRALPQPSSLCARSVERGFFVCSNRTSLVAHDRSDGILYLEI